MKIQALIASMEELTRQNQEMRLQFNKRRIGLRPFKKTREIVKKGVTVEGQPL